MPIEGADYFIRYMELPPKIYAFVHPNEDGTYTLILDSRRDRLTQAVFTPYFVNYHPTTIFTFSLEKYAKTKKKGRKR